MKYLLSLLIALPLLSQTIFDESDFGFDADAADNWTAMKALETYANAATAPFTVNFAAGIYTNVWVGTSTHACDLDGVVGMTINGPEATLFTEHHNQNATFFRFQNSSNITLRLNFRGETIYNSGEVQLNPSVKSIFLTRSNVNFDVDASFTRVYDGLRFGQYVTSRTSPTYYLGNSNIVFKARSTNTHYTFIAYLGQNMDIDVYAEGTAEANWAAHRGVYLSGSSNARVSVIGKNIRWVHAILTTTASQLPPYHIGNTNITIYAKDTGTTQGPGSGRTLVAFSVVENGEVDIPTVTKGVDIIVDVVQTDSVFRSHNVIYWNARGTGAHRWEDVALSGLFYRPLTANRDFAAVHVALRSGANIGYIGADFDGFHDVGPTTGNAPRTIEVSTTVPTVVMRKRNSTIGNVVFADPAKQTLTDWPDDPGDPDPTPGVRIRLQGPAALEGRIR